MSAIKAVYEAALADLHNAAAKLEQIGHDGWQWQDDGSLEPSVNCGDCGTHGWWTSTGWRKA